MNLDQLRGAASQVVKLIGDYTGGHVGSREMLLDPVLYGYLQGKFGHFTRQHHVGGKTGSNARRIDFRFGSSNPVVVEFVVRPPSGQQTLYASQNRGELLKLCRVPKTTARLRVLLLIDLYREPMKQDRLKANYDKYNAGRGNFRRHSVRVVYVHRELEFAFLWHP